MSKEITHVEIIAELAAKCDLTKTDAKRILGDLFELIGDHLDKDESVSLGQTAGKFEVTFREARPGRNPKTGETIQIAARRSIKFKPSKAFTDRLK